jgi:transglutaminase-like putative cysteine protease
MRELVQRVDGHDPATQIRVVRDWLGQHVKFLADPYIDGDVIRAPDYLLAQYAKDGVIQGDCDDVATLAASMLQAIGIPARFTALGFGGAAAPFVHVYAEAQEPSGQWVPLDVTETDERRSRNTPTRAAHWPASSRGWQGLGSLVGFAQGVYLAARAWEHLQNGIGDE